MAISPLTFTGVSSYSSDLQQILSRAVSIASLPIQKLQADQSLALEQKTQLGTFRPLVAALQTSIETLGALGASQSLVASSSNSAKLSVTAGDGAVPGNYTISDVSSLATTPSYSTLQAYATADATAITGGSNYLEFWLGSQKYDLGITSDTDNLSAVRDKINELVPGVIASVIQADDGHVLSVSALSTGSQTMELWTGADRTGSNLLPSGARGSDLTFKLNGYTVTSTSNTVTSAIKGVTFTLSDITSGAESITLSVESDRNQVTGALSSFVNAYNALTVGIDQHVGDKDDVLAGNVTLRETRARMRGISAYVDAGTGLSLADLGLSFDKDGVLSLDASVIGSMSGSTWGQVLGFLGSGSTGFGALAGELASITDSRDGLIQTEIGTLDQADRRTADRIDALTEQVSRMQAALMSRLQAADTVLSLLESQQGLLDASLESLKLVTYGKQWGEK